ncbi:Urokinase-type plasminogen activator [Holothuria leucospilota]|uniref:Urokinase-type plasminogen activator n=1 Tax=Holothuria leucospilota TaxID=206669 RepID=A0A9Q0YGX9_HOLLE|nr:Urokinase-type plasminogen activator [Holothuria leucospilota]
MLLPLQGDSGGPLYCTNIKSGEHELVGIVSYGVSECMPSTLGVYTRVSAFTKWINSRGKKYKLPPWAWVLIALSVVVVLVVAVIVIVKLRD